MRITKVSPPTPNVSVTDPITAFGLAVGWALIMLGICVLSLTLTN